MQGGLSLFPLQGRVQNEPQPMGAGTYGPQESHRNVNPEVHPHLHCFSLYRSFYFSGSNKNFNNSEVKIKFLILHLFFLLSNLNKSLLLGSRTCLSL